MGLVFKSFTGKFSEGAQYDETQFARIVAERQQIVNITKLQ
jgi:hypothetical protein